MCFLMAAQPGPGSADGSLSTVFLCCPGDLLGFCYNSVLRFFYCHLALYNKVEL